MPHDSVLWIFKADGVFRLSGFDEHSGWRVDAHDSGLRLLHPDAAVVVSGELIAWTNRGVVAVSAGGRRLSRPAIGSDLSAIETGLLASSAGRYGVQAVAYESEAELWLMVPDDASDTDASQVYVLNTVTGAWTKQDIQPSAMCLDPADDSLVYTYGSAYGAHRERKGGTYDYCDRDFSVTINSVSVLELTIAAGSGWTPAVGDSLFVSGDQMVVTAVTSATVFDVHEVASFGELPAGATAYEGIACCVEMVAKAGGDPTSVKLWRDGAWHFETVRRLARVTTKSTSDVSNTAASATISIELANEDRPRAVRWWAHRGHGRAVVLCPEICITAACSPWRLSAVSCVFEPVSGRVGRSYG